MNFLVTGYKLLANKSFSNDMTKGSVTKHIVWFTLPLLLGNILQQVYNIVDTIVVGKFLGDKYLAAIGATGSITFLFYTLCLGLATGSGILISQYFGANQKDKLKKAIFNSLFVTLLVGIVFSILSVCLTKKVLQLLNTPEDLLPFSVSYMYITCGGTVIVALYNWINSVMRSLGDSKTPLIFLCIANVLNIFLDILFVVVCDFGIKGAAYATILTQGFAAIASMIFAFKKNDDIKLSKQYLVLDKSFISKTFFTGIPIAIQNGLISISMIVLQRITNSFGEAVMAAYTVGMRIEQFIQQPFSSLNIAMSTFIGQNTGANEKKRVINGFYIGLCIVTGFALVICLVFHLCGKSIVGLFISGSESVSIADFGIRVTSLCYIFLGVIHITRGFLNGAGDVKYALINGIVEVVCRIGFALLLIRVFFVGYKGIWYTTCITWFFTALISYIRYLSGKWKTKNLINEA